MELNLKKARKLEANIQKHLDKGFDTTVKIRVNDTVEEAKNTLAKANKAKAQELLDRIKLLEIRYDIRRQIEAKNEVSGINLLLNEKVLVEKEIVEYSSISGGAPNDKELEDEMKLALETMKNPNSYGAKSSISVQVFDQSFEDALQDEIHAKRKSIESIEDRISEKNLTNKIKLDSVKIKLLQTKRLL
jgi:hypothetical protein